MASMMCFMPPGFLMDSVEKLVCAPVPACVLQQSDCLHVWQGARSITITTALYGSCRAAIQGSRWISFSRTNSQGRITDDRQIVPGRSVPVALDRLGFRGAHNAELLAQAVQQPAQDHDHR